MTSNLELPGIESLTEIGRGGFGVVYKGNETAFERHVAVKVLGAAVDDAAIARFERERRAMGSLSGHPHIVTIFRSGVTDDNRPYLVLEYLPGGNLGERLSRSGPMPWTEVATLGVNLAGALETAHRAGVQHRDVKPSNILVSSLGESKLGDFGIARLQGGTETASAAVTASVVHAPPEIVGGGDPDQRADVYSLGSTLYELMYGKPVFVLSGEESLVPLLARIAMQEAAAPELNPSGVEIPLSIRSVILKSLAKMPEDRQQTAAAFGEELRAAQIAAGQPATPLLVEGAQPDVAPPAAVGNETTTLTPLQPTPDSATSRNVLPAPPAVEPPAMGAASQQHQLQPTPSAADGAISAPDQQSGSAPWLYAAIAALVLVVGGIGGALLARGGDGETETVVGTTIVEQTTGDTDVASETTVVPQTLPEVATTLPVTETTLPEITTTVPATTIAPVPTNGELPTSETRDGVRFSEFTSEDGTVSGAVPTRWTRVREASDESPEYDGSRERGQPIHGVSLGGSHLEIAGTDPTTRDYSKSGLAVYATRTPAGSFMNVQGTIEAAATTFADCSDAGEPGTITIPGIGSGGARLILGCGENLTTVLIAAFNHQDDPQVGVVVALQYQLTELSVYDEIIPEIVVNPDLVGEAALPAGELPVAYTEDGTDYSIVTDATGAVRFEVPTSMTEEREEAIDSPEHEAVVGFLPFAGISVGTTFAEVGADTSIRDYTKTGFSVLSTRAVPGLLEVDELMDGEIANFADCDEAGDRADYFSEGVGTGRYQPFYGCGGGLVTVFVIMAVHPDDPAVMTGIKAQGGIAEIIPLLEGAFTKVVVDATKIPPL